MNTTAPRRGGPRPEVVRVGVFGGGLVLAGLAAAVAGSVASELTAPGATTAVRLVLLVAGALGAGLGLVLPLAGVPGKAHRRVAWTAGLLAAVAALAGYLHGDVGRPGTLAWVVAALAVPTVLETRPARRVWPVPVAALPGAALVVATFGSAHTGPAFVADAVYAVASIGLLGSLAVLSLRSFAGPATGGLHAGRPGGDGSAGDGSVGASGGDGSLGPRYPEPEPGPAAAPVWPVPLTLVVLVCAATAALAGAARILTAGPFSVTDLVGSSYGRAGLAALAFPALAAAVVLAGVRGTPCRRVAPRAWGTTAGDGVPHLGVRSAVASLVAAVGVAGAAVAGLLPAPAPAAVPGQALLRTVALDGDAVPVLIAPMRPGPNLVQLGGGYPAPGHQVGGARGGPAGDGDASSGGTGHHGTGQAGSGHAGVGHAGVGHDVAGHAGTATVEAGGDPVPFVSRPGARGGWAVVDVPAGTSSLTVRMAGHAATVPVDVGEDGGGTPSAALTGRDGPECASAIVGAVLAGGPEAGRITSCPSQTLDREQARALGATVHTMAEKSARTVRLVGDASPRSVAAARLVRDEGGRAGLAFPPDAGNDPNSALVVVSGWERAVDVLGETGARSRSTPTHLAGTFLAPWLLTADVLRQTASAFLPLPFAPNEPDAQRYALALAATHPDTAPSASGYLAWARTSGVPADPRPSLYGAAAVNVPMSIEPPGSTGHHGGPNPASWYPGGTVVPVSGPMDPGGSS